MFVARKILGSTAYQFLGKILTAVLSIVVIKVVTWYLGGIEGYGEYTAVYEFLAFFAVIADMGLYSIAIREMSFDKEKMGVILGNIVVLRTVLLCCVLLLAVIAAFCVPQYAQTRIALGVAIAAVSVFFTMLHGTICSLFQTLYRMWYPTVTAVLGKLIMVAYILFVVFYLTPRGLSREVGFYHLLLAGVIGNVCMYALLYWYSQKFSAWKCRFDMILWKKLFLAALPYGAALILSTIYFRIDTILLSLLREDNLLQVGIFGVAIRILEALTIIPIYFMNSVLPVMSEYIRNNNEKITTLMTYSLIFLAAISFPLLSGGHVLADKLVSFVSTEAYVSRPEIVFYGSDLALQILFWALLFSFFNTFFGYCLVAASRQTIILIVNSACVIINIIGNLIVIPFFGFIGAASVSVLSEFFIFLCLLAITRNLLKISFPVLSIMKIMAASFLMAFFVFLLKVYFTGYLWLLLIPIGGILYIVLLIMFGVVTREMQKILFGKVYI